MCRMLIVSTIGACTPQRPASPALVRWLQAPEWHIAAVGAILANVKPAGLYPTDTADLVQYKSEHSGSIVIFVGDAAKLDVVLSVADQLPKLKAVVCWDEDVDTTVRQLRRYFWALSRLSATAHVPCVMRNVVSRAYWMLIDACKIMFVANSRLQAAGKKTSKDVMSFASFLDMGAKTSERTLDAVADKIEPGGCAGFIYTSGTTGTAISTSFLTVFRAGFSSTPPRPGRVVCSTWCPCLSDAAWCLQSDATLDSWGSRQA